MTENISIWTKMVNYFKQILRMKKIIWQAQHAQFNSVIDREDKLNMKQLLVSSIFILFNGSLMMIYFLNKRKWFQSIATFMINTYIIACFHFIWQPQIFINKIQTDPYNQIQYWYRKQVLNNIDIPNHQKQKLGEMNRQFQAIFIINGITQKQKIQNILY